MAQSRSTTAYIARLEIRAQRRRKYSDLTPSRYRSVLTCQRTERGMGHSRKGRESSLLDAGPAKSRRCSLQTVFSQNAAQPLCSEEGFSLS